MAANPISATEIKSRWRQQFSPPLANNGLRLGRAPEKDKRTRNSGFP